MKKFDAFICGIASISCISVSNFTDVIKKFHHHMKKNQKLHYKKAG
ncbi:hypothetical protein [Fusobacterium nucleatum]